METNSIFIKDNVTSREKLWNLWQGATGNSGGSDQVETVFTGCSGNIQSLDRSWKSEIFLGTSQAKQKTNKIVFEVARLWLHTMIHSRTNEYQGRYSFEKRSS